MDLRLPLLRFKDVLEPRKRYEYGWHCEGCRSAGTATARMLRETIVAIENWVASGLLSDAEANELMRYHGWGRS